MKSPEFVALWSDHRVEPCEAYPYELRHPLVGTLTATEQMSWSVIVLVWPHRPRTHWFRRGR